MTLQVLTALEYTTSIRNQAVKLRKDDHGLGSEDPISVPTLIQEVSETHPDVVAMKGCDKISGQWTSWTYQQLQSDVTVMAKAMIETGLHRHHSVAVIGYNYPHWVISNMAAISAGLVLLLRSSNLFFVFQNAHFRNFGTIFGLRGGFAATYFTFQ